MDNKTRERKFITLLQRVFTADLKAIKRSFNTIQNSYTSCYSIESGLNNLADEDLPYGTYTCCNLLASAYEAITGKRAHIVGEDIIIEDAYDWNVSIPETNVPVVLYFAVKSNPKLLELCEGDIREAIERCIEKDKTEEPVSNEPEYVALLRDNHDSIYITNYLYKSVSEQGTPSTVDKEYVESVLTELLRRDCLDKSYDCQHLLILYKSLRPEAETADEAAKIILDRLSGYDRYCFGEIYAEYARSIGIDGYDILKEEESLAQKVIDMFPPSLAKEYQDNNKIMWALRLALHNK